MATVYVDPVLVPRDEKMIRPGSKDQIPWRHHCSRCKCDMEDCCGRHNDKKKDLVKNAR